MAASIAIAIVSSSAAIYFAYEWRATEHELAMVSSDNARMAQDRDAMKARLDRSSSDLAVLRQNDNQIVRMKGLPIAPHTLEEAYEVVEAIEDLGAPLGHHRLEGGDEVPGEKGRAARAAEHSCSSSCLLTITTFASGKARVISRVAVMPSVRLISMSMKTQSGRCRS